MAATTEVLKTTTESTNLVRKIPAESPLRPFRLKSDCSRGGGFFKIGETVLDGQMDIVIVGTEAMTGKYFGYPETDWAQVLFVEIGTNKPMTLMIKMESLRNLINLFEGIRYADLAIDSKAISMAFKEKSDTEGNKYFVLTFKATEKPIPKNVLETISKIKDIGLNEFYEEHLEMEVKYKGGRHGKD